MNRSIAITLAAGGSLALILGALGFQYIGEMPPCKLCYWQRYPHVAAVVIGVLALFISGRILPSLGALATLSTASIGAYHTGIERGWWKGPTSCTSASIADFSSADLMLQIMSAPLVRCDDVPWELFMLSMANWNMLTSFALVFFWIVTIKRS